jgi:peroxiredoxin
VNLKGLCWIAFLLATTLLMGARKSRSGRRASGFSLPDSDARRHDLQDHLGKWVLIDFMKTDRPRCAELTKTLEQVKAKYGANAEEFSVVIAPPDNINTVGRFVRDQQGDHHHPVRSGADDGVLLQHDAR